MLSAVPLFETKEEDSEFGDTKNKELIKDVPLDVFNLEWKSYNLFFKMMWTRVREEEKCLLACCL